MRGLDHTEAPTEIYRPPLSFPAAGTFGCLSGHRLGFTASRVTLVTERSYISASASHSSGIRSQMIKKTRAHLSARTRPQELSARA